MKMDKLLDEIDKSSTLDEVVSFGSVLEDTGYYLRDGKYLRLRIFRYHSDFYVIKEKNNALNQKDEILAFYKLDKKAW